MSSYGPLASWYDQLTGDVPYEQFADFYQTVFSRDGGEFHLLLDLCCGTGTLTAMMTRRGYEMIGVDASVDMLIKAGEKCTGLTPKPLFLCQSAAELDLYGTVDAAYCSLDGMNYIPPEELDELFHRLRLFIRPGGLFLFDLRSPDWLRSMDGQVYVDEQEDVLCLWRADLDEEEQLIRYGMDIFSAEGELWRRDSEDHIEFIHRFEALQAKLERQGFRDIRLCEDGPQVQLGRQFILAKRGENNG